MRATGQVYVRHPALRFPTGKTAAGPNTKASAKAERGAQLKVPGPLRHSRMLTAAKTGFVLTSPFLMAVGCWVDLKLQF
jgi:hypothetical protein